MDRTDLALCVDLLGPLVLRVDGRAVDVPGARRRALLALLALEGDRGMSAERLIDALWSDDPPGNAIQALYNHVSRLRGHLGPYADRLERHATGYRLKLAPDELDVDAALRLSSTNRQAALALWRGPALVEFRVMPAFGDRVDRPGRATSPAHRRPGGGAAGARGPDCRRRCGCCRRRVTVARAHGAAARAGPGE
ncbi:MAG: AfsR/SARP family transcriptional regulator [Kribbellaceae bacterium]